MGEFQRVAEKLAAILDELRHEGGISADRLPDVISDAVGQRESEINCYPGIPGYHCCNLAFFISLNSPSYAKGRGHLSCRKAMEKLVQHMQGSCFQKTKFALFITDNWDPAAFDEWRYNLDQIKNYANIEVYLLSGRNVSQINL